MPTRNEVLMRSANLLNDFAFKYVFGEDCKEAINVNLKMYSFDHLRMYNIDHINTFCSRR